MIKFKLHIKLAEHRMKQIELAELTNIRPATISAYCNDTNKHIVKEHLDMFCKIFKCSVSDLIEFEEDIN
ncbi:MAG: helix-turn-helix transcriptional regulator [Peptostreptococcaceae bacterium]|uniref:helix-turn-helix domain-containing protein n=1 Tax=Clostridium sp. TaxID=1506 RepID=UPI002911D64F|nr:helix-turn-helix transcriptional regulator [Clostridium sp.]MDU6274080.1 helix-turn-helix transcriptional regulator [Clostridium sp.]MDU7535739.1 helix-turn-helix transcriptional regulator [Peptostreptococcaceae bacterium]